jgi:hypothetical protein
MIFSFGESEHERIEVDVLGYAYPSLGNYWDDNWLKARIGVRAGGFHGIVSAFLMTSELRDFLSQLRPFFETLRGSPEFTTTEGQLSFRLTGDRMGHIEFAGEVVDQAGIGNRLQFKLQFDQTQLAEAVRALEQVASAFPVRGAP